MSWIVYLFGLFHYIFATGTLRLANQEPSGVLVFSGALIILSGSSWQLACHKALASLRPASQSNERYSNPAVALCSRNLGFSLLACPHYTAEILIYMGLAVASGGDYGVVALAIWVVVNLSVTAKRSHAWYCQQFGHSDTSRWAILPFIV